MAHVFRSTALISIAALAFSTQSSLAQAFQGGDITLSYSILKDDSSIDNFTIEGSGEYAISPTFSVQADLAYRKPDAKLTEDNGTFNLHGFTFVTPETALGVYIGYEKFEFNGTDDSAFQYGLEGLHRVGRASFEGYVSGYSSFDVNYSAGLSMDVAINDVFEMGIAYDKVKAKAVDTGFDAATLRGTYNAGANREFFLEVGRYSGLENSSVPNSETFVGLGFTYNFGQGATFKRRSVTDAFGL